MKRTQLLLLCVAILALTGCSTEIAADAEDEAGDSVQTTTQALKYNDNPANSSATSYADWPTL